MQQWIEYGPAYALATVQLAPGESVVAEAGAMVSMTPGIEVQTSSGAAGGGVLGGLKRSMLGGESFFMNTFTAQADSQISFAPSAPGDIVHWELQGQNVLLTSGAFLFCTNGIGVDTKWGGAKTFFSKEGLFLLRVGGTGSLFISSYGAIKQVDLQPGQHYTVDTGHVVAFGEGVGYSVRKFGGWKSTFFGGEGLVVDLTGPGPVWIQTRSAQSFAGWIAPFLPTQSSGPAAFSFGS
ncbi:MAG: TIGR00266 family protein [Acidimicrobiia bacterium]